VLLGASLLRNAFLGSSLIRLLPFTMQRLCHAAWFFVLSCWGLACSRFFASCSAQFVAHLDAGFALGWCGSTLVVHQAFSLLLPRVVVLFGFWPFLVFLSVH
jgi:hypothetical protein